MSEINNNGTIITFKKIVPGVLWFMLVNFLMFLPGKNIPKIGWLEDIYFDKWVHTGSFLFMVFFFCWILYGTTFTAAERLSYFIKIALAASVWGLVVEFIQRFYIPGRSYDLMDWAADSFGAFIGLLLSRKFLLSR